MFDFFSYLFNRYYLNSFSNPDLFNPGFNYPVPNLIILTAFLFGLLLSIWSYYKARKLNNSLHVSLCVFSCVFALSICLSACFMAILFFGL